MSKKFRKRSKQVHLDNDVCQKWTFWDNMGHFGAYWNNTEDCLRGLNLSWSFRIIISHNRLISTGALRTHGWTDRPSYRDAWTHLKKHAQRQTLAIMARCENLTSPSGNRNAISRHRLSPQLRFPIIFSWEYLNSVPRASRLPHTRICRFRTMVL